MEVSSHVFWPRLIVSQLVKLGWSGLRLCQQLSNVSEDGAEPRWSGSSQVKHSAH